MNTDKKTNILFDSLLIRVHPWPAMFSLRNIMKIMLRFILLAIFATGSFAQNPGDAFNKPPADVDQVLRARITEFYDLHVKGEFRKAEAWVAEDTKDIYYTSNKTKYLSFEIGRIDYSDNFTRAKATVLCEQNIMLPGFLGKPMKVQIPSTWK